MSSSTFSTALTTVATALFQALIDALVTLFTNTTVLWGLLIAGFLYGVYRLWKRMSGAGGRKRV